MNTYSSRLLKIPAILMACVLLAYFTLCAVFVMKASFTDYACPGATNTPIQWQFPDKINAMSKQNTKQPRYPMLDVQAWQLPNYQDVVFPSRMANVAIHAWYTKVDPRAPVVIVVHGIRPNCKNAYESLLVSGMLAHGGINVLNIDLQNHGDSTKYSNFIGYGQREYLDLLGAYDWLRTQGYSSNQIGLMGLSLGAVTSAIALAKKPAFAV